MEMMNNFDDFGGNINLPFFWYFYGPTQHIVTLQYITYRNAGLTENMSRGPTPKWFIAENVILDII